MIYAKLAVIPLLALTWALALGADGPARRPPERPNVLFIAVDDLRPELGAYGAEHMITPHIDRLAASGVLFERAYCSVPVCGASRASLLTGLRPRPERFVAYDSYASRQAAGLPSLPEHFRRNGYTSVGYGKVFHEADDSPDAWSEPHWRPRMTLPAGYSRHGYQIQENIDQNNCDGSKGPSTERAVAPDTNYIDNWIARRAVERLDGLVGEEAPFFLAVGFIKPHLPFVAPEHYWRPYDSLTVDLDPVPPPAGAPARALHDWRELRAYPDIPREGDVTDAKAAELIRGYYAAVSFVDAQIGLVLDALEASGEADDTIVVLWGDHGYSLREHGLWVKHSSFDVAMRSPLLIRYPPVTPAGTRVAAVTEFVDIYPTLCELAGLPHPGHLQGESFADCIDDTPSCPATGQTAYARYEDQDILRTDTFLYTEWYDERGEVIDRMLYDLVEDPQETVNLAEDPAQAARIERYHARIEAERDAS